MKHTGAHAPGSRYRPRPPQACLQPGALSAPAVLCLHGTDQTVGHGTVVGLSERENRSYARCGPRRGSAARAPFCSRPTAMVQSPPGPRSLVGLSP